MNSNQQIFRSNITYAGYATTLLTTSPPVPLADVKDEPAGSSRTPLLEPVFTVRYVCAFPSLVVREIPNGSVWSYYADTWTSWDFMPFFFWSAMLVVAGVCFYRHVRKSRRRQRR